MLETQPNWYTFAPRILGWHIGLWNLVGAIGFTVRLSYPLPSPTKSATAIFLANYRSYAAPLATRAPIQGQSISLPSRRSGARGRF